MKHINFKLIHYPFILVRDISPNPPPPADVFLITEDFNPLITESGENLIIE